MDCRECKELIVEKSIGVLTKPDDERVKSHIAVCADCRTFFKQEKAITSGIRGLDSNVFRTDSIAAFSRLALMVRSYRNPKPVFESVFQIKGMRVASVVAVMFLIVIGLSTINYSYSYTNGASMHIAFNPPLEKLESLNSDEFNQRITNAIDNVVTSSDKKTQVSWALAIEQDSLKSVMLDVKTDKASEVAKVYDSLLDEYPSFSLGQVSVSAIQEPVNSSIGAYLIAKKKDVIEEDDIKNVVNTDFRLITVEANDNLRRLDNSIRRIDRIIGEELPYIRELIRTVNGNFATGGEAIVKTSPQIHGGAQIGSSTSGKTPSEFVRWELKRIFENNGLRLSDQDYKRLIHVELGPSATRLMIGDTSDLFAPSAVGGYGLTVIQASDGNVKLNGIGELVKAEEISNVLNGVVNPKDLESSINERLEEKQINNERILIEVEKGDRKAEVMISPDGAKVDFKFNRIFEELPDYSNRASDQSESKARERDELTLESEEELTEDPERKSPPPMFTNQYGVLPEYILEGDIKKLLEGKITTDELEETIEKRIIEKKLNPGYQNIFIARDGRTINIKIANRNVRVEISNWVSPSQNGNLSVVVFNEDEKKASKPDLD